MVQLEQDVPLIPMAMIRLSEGETKVLGCVPTPLLVLDQQFRLVFVNESAARVLRYDLGELEGHHIETVVPEQLRERYRQLRHASLQGAARARREMRGERIFRTKDGEEIPVELLVSPAVIGGQELYICGFADISLQKHSEQETIERLHSIVEHSDVGIFLVQVTEDGAFLFESFNPIAEKFTGLKSEQARGRRLDQVVSGKHAERIAQNYQRCVDTGRPVTFEETFDALNGGLSFRTTVIPIRNSEGRVHRLIGLARETTEQRRVERDLAAVRRSLGESEEKFRKIFSVCPNPIAITELSSGRVLEVNDAFERVFGYSRNYALGKTTFELGVWRDAKTRKLMLEQARARGAFRDLELQGIDHMGSVLTLLLSGEVIEIDGIECLVTYIHDVSEERANKRALAESEERFSKAFGASPDALAIFDLTDARMLEVNEGFVRLFGRERHAVIGKTTVEAGLWASPTVRDRALQILQRERSLRDFPIDAQRVNGEIRECLLSAEVLDIGPRPCAVVTIRDVTLTRRAERERAELERQLRQSQKLDALGTLAGGIAHDFNNILGAIQAYAELIKLDKNEPEVVETHVAELQRAADRAAELVRQILTFSRKQPQQKRSPVNIEEAVHEALSFVRAAISSTIVLKVEFEPNLPLVLADATQLHQVIMNLCTNAAHAMKTKQGTLSVRLEGVDVDAELKSAVPELQERRYARLTVSDTGEGIPSEVTKHIFEPFFTTKPPGEGTGLGLSVVHGIVREHEGAIVVESAVGEGTKVTVYLPEFADQLWEGDAPASELVPGNGELVLFVDDERVLCESVPALLERLGYRVEAHSSATTALTSFARRANEYGLVLTDLTMPVMTGIELAQKVHALEPRTPIVVMTGYGGNHTAESLRQFGVHDVILKPLSARALARCLAQSLAQRRSLGPHQMRS